MNRILIAEDEPRLASFLEKGLRSNGFVTTTVGDGARAVMLADEEDFDLQGDGSVVPALDETGMGRP